MKFSSLVKSAALAALSLSLFSTGAFAETKEATNKKADATVSSPANATKKEADKKAVKKPAASNGTKKEPSRKKAVKKPASSVPVVGKKITASSANETQEQILAKLDQFSVDLMTKMNRLSIPSKSKKAFTKNADGTYSAGYREVDLNSIKNAIRKTDDNKSGVDYIGYMRYTEVEYVCTAKTAKEAAEGPFKVRSKEGLTELVKYVKGTWGF